MFSSVIISSERFHFAVAANPEFCPSSCAIPTVKPSIYDLGTDSTVNLVARMLSGVVTDMNLDGWQTPNFTTVPRLCYNQFGPFLPGELSIT